MSEMFLQEDSEAGKGYAAVVWGAKILFATWLETAAPEKVEHVEGLCRQGTAEVCLQVRGGPSGTSFAVVGVLMIRTGNEKSPFAFDELFKVTVENPKH